MTPEAQRIAIAEACGWRVDDELEDGALMGHIRPTPNDWEVWDIVPDYLTDLNAMHEAEKTLGQDDSYRYGDALAASVRKPELEAMRREGMDEDDQFPFNGWGHFAVAHLTAAQRAEAFLKTKGLWK